MSIERQSQYLDYLISPNFQGVNRLFVLWFENNDNRKVHNGYFLPKVEIKDYNVMIDGQKFSDQPVKNYLRVYNAIRKIVTFQGDDYTIGCLLNYPYFKEHYKPIAMDLIIQQALDADPQAIKQINFTANQARDENTTIFFIIEKAKETLLGFTQGTVQVL